MLGMSVLVLFVSAMSSAAIRNVVASSATATAGLAGLVVSLFQWHDVVAHGARSTIAHAVIQDGFSVVASAVISVSLIALAPVAHAWAQRDQVRLSEFTVLLLATASGAYVMAQAGDLLVLFLGLEILSIGLYVLAAFDRRRTKSAEASLKYFLLGSLASALFIYGVALIYGGAGSTNLSSIGYFLAHNLVLHPGLLYAGAGLLLVGFGFKVAAVPFHQWSPDVYEGAPTPVTAYMAAVVKIGAFAGVLRVFSVALGTQAAAWRPLVLVLIVASTFIGAGLAIVQRNVKRLLAYSSINHAGFMLLGLWAATPKGAAGTLYYLMTYAPVAIATFAVVTLVGGHGDAQHDLSRYRGLARRQPVLGGALAVLLLAQAGAPFTTGFFAKFGVLSATVVAGGAWLAVATMVAATMAAFFYVRVVLALYADEEHALEPVAVPRGAGIVIVATAAATILFGIWVGPLSDLANRASLLFFK
jgi:NADH-quinone oxidoreductase subunit N